MAGQRKPVLSSGCDRKVGYLTKTSACISCRGDAGPRTKTKNEIKDDAADFTLASHSCQWQSLSLCDRSFSHCGVNHARLLLTSAYRSAATEVRNTTYRNYRISRM